MNDEVNAQQQTCVLVVEDDEDLRRMIVQLLERARYQVALAADGQTALTQAKQHHPDLILMDLSLPDMNVWETVRLLRKIPEFGDTPIIAVTAHVSAANQERALAVGCTAPVSKPFKSKNLLQTIEHVLKDRENAHER